MITSPLARPVAIMPNVDSAYVALLHEHLDAKQMDPVTILGKPPRDGARVSVLRWKRMLELGATATGETAFGLRVAANLQVRHFGLFGYLLMSCSSLLEAMALTQRYSALVSDNNPSTLNIRGDQVEFCVPQIHGWVSQASDEVGLGTVVRFARMITGQSLRPLRAEFVGPRPSSDEFYRLSLGCEVHFDCEMPRLILPASSLSTPCQNADPVRFNDLDAMAARRLAAVTPLPSDIEPLRRALVALIRQSKVHVDDLATLVCASARTLHRRLSKHGISFQVLLDQTRRQLAEQYLVDPRIALSEVAGLIGFSEQSAFNRAFSQWTGESPGSWRRLQLELVRES